MNFFTAETIDEREEVDEVTARTTVTIDQIRIDGGTQVRAAISEQVVTDYAERMLSGATFPPVVLFHDGLHYYLADGFHRTLAAQRNGLTEIPSDVRAGTKQDALWFALGANKANGHQMTPQDKRHAILLALQAWPQKSSRELAEQIGCNHSYIIKLKPEVEVVTDSPRADRVTGKDGKSYPASRSATEKPASDPEPGFKSRVAVAQRKERMREMAAEGYTSAQIAASVGVGVEGCRDTLRRSGIEVPADKVAGGLHRHDSTRIVEHIVMDAENLIADVNLIDFSDLDRARIAEWLIGLKAARNKLGAFIGRLSQEQQKNGEAA